MATLPSSGELGLSNVASVFGGTAPFFMTNYYAGAASGFVPSGTSGIPTSGQMNLSSFWGKSKSSTTITLNNSGSALTDHVINFSLAYNASYATNFQDLRFRDETTGTILQHWYESVSNSSSANVWLKVPTLTNGRRINVTTGNASTTGNPSSVFPLYENFSAFDTTNIWTASTASYTASTNNFQFTSGGPFVYMVTRSNYPANMVVEANLSSGNGNAIPEIIMRGNISTNTGIKARADCRGPGDGGVGSFLFNPFNNWNILSAPFNFSFPSNGTFQKLTFSGISSNFAFSYNNTPTTTYSDTNANYNSSGVIGFANHNGTPVSLQWIRAYPSTANTVSVSISTGGSGWSVSSSDPIIAWRSGNQFFAIPCNSAADITQDWQYSLSLGSGWTNFPPGIFVTVTGGVTHNGVTFVGYFRSSDWGVGNTNYFQRVGRNSVIFTTTETTAFNNRVFTGI
jgi:hypothetical protein